MTDAGSARHFARRRSAAERKRSRRPSVPPAHHRAAFELAPSPKRCVKTFVGSGVMADCIGVGTGYVLAGSIRGDGPLAVTQTGLLATQAACAERPKART